ncbi:hypothetical protein [Rudaea sp.]|uniref:hypothetical protein n=1 Tax=Rudaea sp. TaxID=2136325 RepID=UPI0032205B1D
MSARIALTMRASSLQAQGCAFNELRHGLAHPKREARRARHPGRILFGSFLLCGQEKGTRAPDARGKAKDAAKEESKPRQKLDSSLRWNDEPKAERDRADSFRAQQSAPRQSYSATNLPRVDAMLSVRRSSS